MNAFNTVALGVAGAFAGGLVMVVCFTIYALIGTPDPWMDLFVGSGPRPLGWLVGIAEGAAVGGLTGLIVGAVYNRAARA